MLAAELQQINSDELLVDLLGTIVSCIGKSTSKPEIRHYPNDALFTLQVDGRDQGRFVGKQGRTIWSISTLFWYAGLTQYGWSYSVQLLEPETQMKGRAVPIKITPKWDRKKIQNLIDVILDATLRSYAGYSLLEMDDTSLIVNLKLLQYLRINLSEPDFVEAFETVMRAAGMSQGCKIKVETIFS